MNYTVKYLVDNKTYQNESEFLKIDFQCTDKSIKLVLHPQKEIILLEARINFNDSQEKNEYFYSNGYQSWTDTLEESRKDKTKKLGILARCPLVEKKFHIKAYGDYTFIEYHKHYSFSFTYLRNKDNYRFYGSLNERTGYTVFYLEKNNLKAYKDIKNLHLKSTYDLFDIALFKGKENEVFDAYMNSFTKKIKITKKIKGFTTWYRHYENINEDIIRKDLEDAKNADIGLEFFQVDDGYETYVGDWTAINKEKFPHGLKQLAKNISEAGFKPGLWLAPFVASPKSDLFKKHPDYFLKDNKGHFIYAGCNWSGAYILDIYNSGVREYLHSVFSELKDDGFILFKLDFLYAVSLGQRTDKTRGQVMSDAMDFLRKELEDRLILGCGVPLFPAFFDFDYCRIGADISLNWDGPWYMKLVSKERVSSKQSRLNTINRKNLDHRFLLNDPDVILLTETKMSEKQRLSIYETDKKYGSVFFTSDNLSLYTEKEKKLFRELNQGFNYY